MHIAGVIHAKEEVMIDPSSQNSWLLPNSLSCALRCDVEIETLDKQLVVKGLYVGCHRLPVHIEPHGRHVLDTVS